MKRIAFLLVCVTASVAQAQRGSRECLFDFTRTTDSSSSTSQVLQNGKRMLWLSNGFKGVCRGTKMVIVGDSGEYNDDSRIVKLIGHAKYSEDSVSIIANTMTYN